MPRLVRDSMQTHVPTALPTQTVASVRRAITGAEAPWDSINYIYILDRGEILVGVVSIKELLAALPTQKIDAVMQRDPVAIRATRPAEHAAALAVAHSLKAIPIVDADHRFLGIIPSDIIQSILHRYHTEQVLRAGGFSHPRVVDVLTARFGMLFRARVPWLFAGLLGGLGAAVVVHAFEGLLQHNLLLAFFVPLVLYLSAATGAQTGTLFVRSLAIERVNFFRYAAREMVFGFTLGILFGVIGYGVVFGVWGDARVALILAFTLALSMIFSVVIALVIPWALFRLGRDPAMGSGPFATIIQDVLSLTIYFSIASLLL